MAEGRVQHRRAGNRRDSTALPLPRAGRETDGWFDDGRATWDGGESFRAQKPDESGSFINKQLEVALPEIDATGLDEGHTSLIQQFVRCIREDDTLETICTDNIKSLAMVFGAIESAETGQRVEIQT